MRKLITILFILTPFNPTILFGQIFHTDPYQIDFLYLRIEQNRQEIQDNKVKAVTTFNCELKDCGKQKKKNYPIYKVTFDTFGNPKSYYQKNTMACWWWPTLLQKLKIQKKITTSYDYSFFYDSLQNLIHAKELIVKTYSPSHDENDIYYVYDNQNRLINQTIFNKTIYKLCYKYRGVSYHNDTSVIKHSFFYDNSNKVTTITTITQWRNDYEMWQNTKHFDTLKFNNIFDSLFISKVNTRGNKLDSLGRIVEATLHSVHALTIGGDCISPNSPNDIIVNYFYNKEGKLSKSESHKRTGDFVERRFWSYNKAGLLLSIQAEKSKQITIYKYDFY